tara:strand:+ start:236 stop:628 length:393 start_codon:yes stop_codon:yes gene_type:complete
MYKFILSLICFLISFPCFAKWKKIIENKNFTQFVEINSIEKKNGVIYLWTLKDFKKKQKDGEQSLKLYSRFSCKEIKYETLSIISYKTKMGKGRDFSYKKNVKDYSDNTKWIFPQKSDEGYELIKAICNT